MLHRGDYYFVSGANVRSTVGVSDKIDRFSRAANKDYLLRMRGIEEPLRLCPSFFILPGRTLAQEMHATVNVRIVSGVVVSCCFNDRGGLLTGRGIVQIDERLAVDGLLQ